MAQSTVEDLVGRLDMRLGLGLFAVDAAEGFWVGGVIFNLGFNFEAQREETIFEILPRLNEIKSGSGVIGELLFLDLPRECKFPYGMMKLVKEVQECIRATSCCS